MRNDDVLLKNDRGTKIFSLSSAELNLILIKGCDLHKGIDFQTEFPCPFSAVLENLLNDDTGAYEGGTGLLYNIRKTFQGFSPGEKIVHQQNPVAGLEKLFAHKDLQFLLFGEGENFGGKEIII